MLVIALVLAGLAAALHVYIFVLESVLWEAPRTRATFGTTAEVASATKPLAFNQGFYNLFLAIGAGVGIALVGADRHASIALVVLALGSMLAAALVLVASDRTKASAAVTQGAFPALSLLALLIHALG